MPRLEAFRVSHPDIQINLSCSYESLHFSRDKIDVDIRHGRPNWPSYEVRTLRDEKFAVLASPQLLARRPVHSAADLLDRELILSEATLLKWPEWFARHGLARPEKPYALSFDRSYMTLEATSHGLGFALEHLAGAKVSGHWRTDRSCASRIDCTGCSASSGLSQGPFRLPQSQKIS